MGSRHSRVWAVMPWVAQASGVLLAIWLGIGGPGRDLRVPIRFSEDAVVFLAQIKSTVDHGWWWTNPSLGAPTAFNALLFPSNSNVDQLVVRLIAFATDDAGLVANLAWIALVVLSGLTAAAVFQILGLSRAASLVCGAVFALGPYAVYRNLTHFNLVTLLVPFPCGVALLLAAHRDDRLSGRRLLALLLGCTVLGFNYVYYAFFGAFIVIVGGLSRLTRPGRGRPAAVAAAAVGLICLATFANLLPSLTAWRREGEPLIVRQKLAAESEVYGLKVRQMVSPVFDHEAPILRDWVRKESQAGFPLETENMISRLGLVASLGFLGAVAVALLCLGDGRSSPYLLVSAAGRLSVACVLLATVGGFGALFALLVSPEIRAWNRITPFVMCLALVPLGLLLDRLPSRRARVVAGGLVLAVALGDQWWPMRTLAREHAPIAAEYASLAAVVGRMERALPDGAMVLQLPFTVYLNDTGTEQMRSYDHFKPYLVSTHLRWSYPALSNQQFEWQQAAARLPIPELVGTMKADGFSAILVDRNGFADHGAGTSQALEAAGSVRLVEDERYALFDLRPVPPGRKLVIDTAPITRALASCGTSAVHNLDLVGQVRGPFGGRIEVPAGADVSLVGWILLPDGPSTAQGVEVLVDDVLARAVYGFERTDVAQHFGRPDARNSGYRITIPGGLLAPGVHRLSIRALSRDRTCFVETPAAELVAR